MTSMEEWHVEEDLAKEKIRKINPNHPILKKCFSSTHDAIEAYYEVEHKLSLCSDRSITKEDMKNMVKKKLLKIDYVGIALYSMALKHYQECAKFEKALEKHLKIGDLVSPWDCLWEGESYEDLMNLIKDVKKDEECKKKKAVRC